MKPYFEEKGITIYHADCREVLPSLSKVDLVLTDPPYSTPVMTSFGRETCKNFGDLSIQAFYLKSLEKDFNEIVKGSVVIHCDDAYSGIVFASFYHWNICQFLIWNKGQIGMGRPFRRQHEMMVFASKGKNLCFYDEKTRSTVLNYSPVPSEQRLHGAEKPLDLACDVIAALCPPEGAVLDCFMGSGTSLRAAKDLNRKAIGIDINEAACEIAAHRLRQEVFGFGAVA